MKKTIGIFAHVDAGKTTLSEALLYECGAIRKKGSVDSSDTVMDSSKIEKERGITCFSNVAGFSFGEDIFYLIDTPGHQDFISDTERCMSALDYAILIVDAVSGVKSNTLKLWSLLKEKNIPTIIFINKCDADTADKSKTIRSIKTQLSTDCSVYRSDAFYELIAESDDLLLADFLDGNIDIEKFENRAYELVNIRKFFPIICGSAQKSTGIKELLTLLNKLNKPMNKDEKFTADIFKVRYEKDRRIVYMHITSGGIKVRDMLPNSELVTELRMSDGTKEISVQSASVGDVIGVCGSKLLRAGESIGKKSICSENIPLFKTSLKYPSEINIRDMMRIMKIFEDEEPTLCVECNNANNEISVCTGGEIALEVLKYQLKERFDIDADFGTCKVIYKETVASPVIGYGHYEPLKHYAEVHLRIEPMPRGSGITFESEYPLDLLTKNYQNLIKTHVFEKKHKGVLVGGELADVKIVLTFGKAHLKHTEGGDFREATYRAIRQGLMKADSVLLEPYSICKFTVDISQRGKVISDIGTMFGETLDVGDEISARMPSVFVSEYQKEFNSFTRGMGIMSSEFDCYDIAHNRESAIEGAGYNYKTDIENTPDSVFCAHGAGFNVFWQDVEKYMIKE